MRKLLSGNLLSSRGPIQRDHNPHFLFAGADSFQGPAQPSPALGDALNAGYRYLEVKCLGCSTHQTVALDIVRRPKATPIHELERYMRCKDCSAGLSVQEKPSSCAADNQDFGERSAVALVAG